MPDKVKRVHAPVVSANLPWTLVPNIPVDVTDALHKTVRTNVLPVTWSPPPSELLDLPALAELRAALRASGIEKKVQWLLVSEAAKGTAERNKQKLYDRDGMMVELREQIGAAPMKLSEIAVKENVTTSDLAVVLAGRKLMNMVIDSEGTNSEFSPGLEALAAERGYTRSELAARVAIAVEALKIADEQANKQFYSLAAMQCVPRNSGGSGCTKRYVADQTAAGKRGESALVVDLMAYGIEPHQFRTEKEQIRLAKEAGLEPPLATPDILFEEPQPIMGYDLRWIDAKNSAIIPGVSNEQMMEKLRNQAAKYAKLGPGAFFWTKCGFPEIMVGELGDRVVHLRRTVARSCFRTTLCKHFSNGFCMYGDRCTFAHGEEQLRDSVGDCVVDELSRDSVTTEMVPDNSSSKDTKHRPTDSAGAPTTYIAPHRR